MLSLVLVVSAMVPDAPVLERYAQVRLVSDSPGWVSPAARRLAELEATPPPSITGGVSLLIGGALGAAVSLVMLNSSGAFRSTAPSAADIGFVVGGVVLLVLSSVALIVGLVWTGSVAKARDERKTELEGLRQQLKLEKKLSEDPPPAAAAGAPATVELARF
ncbi:MAG: hypothetical protein U0228_26395 [Myxococcaceae bacterium]